MTRHTLEAMNYAMGLEEERTEKIIETREDSSTLKVTDQTIVGTEKKVVDEQRFAPPKTLLFRGAKSQANHGPLPANKPGARPLIK